MTRWRPRWRCSSASICASRAVSISSIACRCCCAFCPISSLFSVVVCYVFNLTTTKWRFISLPDALNILRAATVLTRRRCWCWTIFSSRPIGRQRHVLPRQGHHRPLLVPRDVLPERVALCLSLFSLYPRAPSCPHRGCVADAADRPRRRCRDSAARHRKRRGQAALAGRRVVAVERPIAASRSAIFRCLAGSTISRT